MKYLFVVMLLLATGCWLLDPPPGQPDLGPAGNLGANVGDLVDAGKSSADDSSAGTVKAVVETGVTAATGNPVFGMVAGAVVWSVFAVVTFLTRRKRRRA